MYLKVIYEGQCFNFEPRQDKKENTLGSDISRKVQHHAMGTMTSQVNILISISTCGNSCGPITLPND